MELFFFSSLCSSIVREVIELYCRYKKQLQTTLCTTVLILMQTLIFSSMRHNTFKGRLIIRCCSEQFIIDASFAGYMKQKCPESLAESIE